MQQHAPFFFRQLVDVGREMAVDEQRLALGHGMGANDRMRCPREHLALVVAAHQHVGSAVDVIAGMGRGEPFEIDLHARRKRIVGCILAGKEGIAAGARHGVQVEDAAERGLLVAGDVRVPILAADALGIGIGMDRQNLGMSFRTRRIRVDVQLTEISAESLVGFHVQRLIAEEENLMLGQRLMHLLDLPVAERFRQYDALDSGANTRRDGTDADGVIGHGKSSRATGA